MIEIEEIFKIYIFLKHIGTLVFFTPSCTERTELLFQISGFKFFWNTDLRN